jgi:hypothetical protein
LLRVEEAVLRLGVGRTSLYRLTGPGRSSRGARAAVGRHRPRDQDAAGARNQAAAVPRARLRGYLRQDSRLLPAAAPAQRRHRRDQVSCRGPHRWVAGRAGHSAGGVPQEAACSASEPGRCVRGWLGLSGRSCRSWVGRAHPRQLAANTSPTRSGVRSPAASVVCSSDQLSRDETDSDGALRHSGHPS